MAHVGNDPACFCLLPVDARAAGRCGNLVHRLNSSLFFPGRANLSDCVFQIPLYFLAYVQRNEAGVQQTNLVFFFIKSANPI